MWGCRQPEARRTEQTKIEKKDDGNENGNQQIVFLRKLALDGVLTEKMDLQKENIQLQMLRRLSLRPTHSRRPNFMLFECWLCVVLFGSSPSETPGSEFTSGLGSELKGIRSNKESPKSLFPSPGLYPSTRMIAPRMIGIRRSEVEITCDDPCQLKAREGPNDNGPRLRENREGNASEKTLSTRIEEKLTFQISELRTEVFAGSFCSDS